jgi:hypothetical protein
MVKDKVQGKVISTFGAQRHLRREVVSQFPFRHNLKVTRSVQAKRDTESRRRPGESREPDRDISVYRLQQVLQA